MSASEQKYRTLLWALRNSNAKHSDKLVLIVMADAASDDGICTESIADLCRRAGLSTNTVKKALRSLEQGGQIRCAVTPDGRQLHPVPHHLAKQAEDGRAVYQLMGALSPLRNAA